MAKLIFFLIVVIIMFFPLFISTTNPKMEKKAKSIPLIEIFNGNYKNYSKNGILEINGSFQKGNFFKGYKEFKKLLVNNLLRKESFFIENGIKKGEIVKGNRARYVNENYRINSKKILYNVKNKTLKGWEFNFVSKNASGKGKYFEIDKDKNIFAKNVVYFIKVNE